MHLQATVPEITPAPHWCPLELMPS
jgi:hypothetical protein